MLHAIILGGRIGGLVGTLTLPRAGIDVSLFEHASELRIDAGIPFALGSDGPLNPYLNLIPRDASGTLRRSDHGRASRRGSYTHGSAYAEFQEEEKGTIARGKLADLAVLSQDIFSVPVAQLPATESVMTITDGQIVYDSGDVRSAKD